MTFKCERIGWDTERVAALYMEPYELLGTPVDTRLYLEMVTSPDTKTRWVSLRSGFQTRYVASFDVQGNCYLVNPDGSQGRQIGKTSIRNLTCWEVTLEGLPPMQAQGDDLVGTLKTLHLDAIRRYISQHTYKDFFPSR